MTLEWAVLPVAGRGTRMYPAAAVVPKALLPVGLKPMLHWALEEALDAGIERLVLVRGPEQCLVQEYVEAAIASGAEDGPLGKLGRRLGDAEVRWVIQESPRGVGDAFMRCRRITGESDFGVLLPDNWFHAAEPAISQVARSRARTGFCALGLTHVSATQAQLFGNVGGVDLTPVEGDTFRIDGLQDKGRGTFVPAAAGQSLRGCARYALGPEFYDALAATGPPTEGEWDDVPAFQHLIRTTGLAGHRLDAVHFDVGFPAGYLAAAAWLASGEEAVPTLQRPLQE